MTTAQSSPLNCGGSGGTCTVKTLYDKSGNGRDHAQATIASRLTLALNCINTSLPCMVQTGAQSLQASTSVGSVATNSFMGVYSRSSGPYANGQIVGGPAYLAAQFLGVAGGSASDIVEDTGAKTIGATVSSAFHLAVGVINGSSSFLGVDGTNTTGTISGGYGFCQVVFCTTYVGTNSSADDTQIEEVGFINSTPMTTGQATALHTNVSARLGTP